MFSILRIESRYSSKKVLRLQKAARQVLGRTEVKQPAARARPERVGAAGRKRASGRRHFPQRAPALWLAWVDGVGGGRRGVGRGVGWRGEVIPVGLTDGACRM